jgi:glycine oxidase
VGQQFDVAVCGAGIVGAAIAWECATRGAKVVLLDRGEPGAQASGAAAGMLAPCSEAHESGAFLDLARDSLALWPDFAARLHEESGVDPELDLGGLLRVAVDDGAAEDVQAQLRWQASAGIGEGRWVDTTEARELEPALRPDIAGAAWYPGEGHVHGRRAVAALVEALRRRGGEVRRRVEVRSPADVPGAQRIVLTGGAWLGDLSAAFGSALPVRPVHGQLAALHGIPHPPRRVVYAGRHGYVVTKADGTVLAGATEEDRGFDTTPQPQVTEALHRKAARLIEGAEQTTSVTAWTGLRPCAPDRLPLLGPLPRSDPDAPVLVAGGHYRNGVLLAPITARGIAGMLLDGVIPTGWEAFDPRRFC